MSDKTLLIIIPCLNEEKTIGTVLSKIPKKIDGIAKLDILVVDDGSTDNSISLAVDAGAKCISHQKIRGVGAAFRTGVNYARIADYNYIVNLDGDGQFDPGHIPQLLAPILAREADMVTASRFKNKDFIPTMPAIKKWGNFKISGLVSLLTGQKFHDVSCGFRAYNKDVIRNMSLLGDFTYTHETILQTVFQGYTVLEIPLKIRGEREFGESRVANDLWAYAKQTISIIGSTIISYRPFIAFGIFALIFSCIGISLGTFFFFNRIMTGTFEPHIWAGFSSAYFIGLALVSLLFGQAAFMFTRLHIISKNEINLLADMMIYNRNLESQKVRNKDKALEKN